MKSFISLLSIVLIASAVAGQKEIGNGGGVWVCYDDERSVDIRWIQLVDLYEAKVEFSLTLKKFPHVNYKKIVSIINKRLEIAYPGFQKVVEAHVDRVIESIIEVESDLAIIDDALYRIKPSNRECKNGRVSYEQLANFTKYKKVLLNGYLFNHNEFSEVNKAALIYHEAIYSYLRDNYQDTNSVKTRKIVGLIFSNISNEELRLKVSRILGFIKGSKFEMSFSLIPKGSFLMGSRGRNQNELPHIVTISKDFEIMTTEVTQKMYFDVTGENPSTKSSVRYCKDSFEKRLSPKNGKMINLCPNHPVENVSYYDVQNFIKELNKKSKSIYRLPTEAEWEYAARGGTESTFFFGNDFSDLFKYANYLGGKIQNRVKVDPDTYSVGPTRQYQNLPNQYGLFDVYGNVWEWTQDWYTDFPVGGIDPKGPAEGTEKVMRGGCYDTFADYSRSAGVRVGNPLDNGFNCLGFRLVRELK